MLQEADDQFFVSAKYILELSKRAKELFESSKIEQRRQIIKLVLSNLTLEGKKLRYEAVKPFDTILNCADGQRWLPLLDSFHNGFMEGKLTYSLSEVDHFTKQLAHLLVETSIRMDVV